MRNGCYAAIDVGTNAARMVIKEASFSKKGKLVISSVQEIRIPLRLGFDVFDTGSISFRKEEQLIETMKCCRSLMNIYGVIDYRAYGTSAMREAKNGPDIIERIRKETGIDMQIVSGKKEASTISTILHEFSMDKGVYLSCDVGGGSTEISLIKDGETLASDSFPIGTIRILAGKDKKETWGRLEDLLDSYHKEYGDLDIITTGGNINRYWKISPHETKKGINILKVATFNEIYLTLKNMTVEERRSKYKLKNDRADVIVPAGDIFAFVSKKMNSKLFYVPMTGLGDAIVDSLIESSGNVI